MMNSIFGNVLIVCLLRLDVKAERMLQRRPEMIRAVTSAIPPLLSKTGGAEGILPSHIARVRASVLPVPFQSVTGAPEEYRFCKPRNPP